MKASLTTAITKAGRQGAYLWRWGAEALQGSPSTGPILHLASRVREEKGLSAIAQKLQRRLRGGSGSKEQIRGQMLLGHKLRLDQPQLGHLKEGV
ncbi:uncharacterized, partial [Tachysurus ichikawai]